ncbi:hypothetical protein N0V86_009281 [Didymella sp. IMI 355093]|nr:hypothetical protein N0V86_009281 [Didymella sp. IMI 355093]
MNTIAPLTPQPSPTRRRPEEAILMDDLRRARSEMQSLREELQIVQEERDKWRNRNYGMPAECYEIIKQYGLESNLSLATLQYLDAPAAVRRLEAHDQYMQTLFAKESCDLAATVQTITLEIQFVKTNSGGDTLRWRLYSALNLMLHISKGLRRVLTQKHQDVSAGQNRVSCDDYLRSTLKSADVQLLSTLNEVRERGMDDHYQAFCEHFAPEYDIIHNEYALEFYEKTKVMMVQMYSQRRFVTVPQARLDERVARGLGEEEEAERTKTTWI